MVDNMISRGAQATPDEQEQIVAYLVANFGVGTPAPKNDASGEQSAESGEGLASLQTPPVPILNDSQIARAKQLITSNGCTSCHRLNGKGSFAGPYLGDAGAKDSATQIRTSLVSPSRELAPENRSVRLITPDGKVVVGRLLNQDGFTVQLIDASGHLLSFNRANLREFTIITANSMPSYANRMMPHDLALLVSYLGSLRGTSQQ